MKPYCHLLLIAFAWAALCGGSSQAETNWPYWRGPQMNQTSAETDLPDTWNPKGGEGSNVLWKRDIGSRSTPVLLNGRLYLITTDHLEEPSKAREMVVCLDAETGETIWEFPFNVYLSDVPIERVGWSSVVADPESGKVFVQGVCGYFACLDGATGELEWDHSLHEEHGLLSTYGGRTNFPIVHEDNVIVNAVFIGWGGNNAKPAHRFMAFDINTGLPVYFESTRLFPYDTTYSAPVLAVIDGELQMIFGSGDGAVHGFQPRTGKELWKYNISQHGLNLSPLVVGNKVYCGHSEENLDVTDMGALFCLDATKRGDISKTGEVWRINGLGVGRSSPIHIDGKLYVIEDTGRMHIIDAETGKELETVRLKDRAMRATPLLADGKLYFGTMNGMTYVLQPKPEGGVTVLQEQRLPRGEEVHGSAIAVNGRVYFPTTAAMYCIGNAEVSDAGKPVPEGPQETARTADTAPAQVQVVPVENLLRPGYRQAFQVRLYNAKGRFLRVADSRDCQFSLEGPGSINEEGIYTIGSDFAQHAPAYVSVKHGEMTGTARIRVVPDLDWKFEFSDGQIPVTWVGCSYRHVPLDWDLLSRLRQEDPMAADLYIYIQTGFVNTGAPVQTYDDSAPPRLAWSELLRFVRLLNSPEKPKNVEEGKARLGPSLKRLEDEKVLSKVEWTTWDRKTGVGEEVVKEPKLVVTRGDRPFDGNGVMCKITTIPLGTRSQGWMGHPDLHDYTIQADVLGYERDGQRADIGITAQRYHLLLMGQADQLQIKTWYPQLNRFSVTVPFEWEPNVWYTMKFQAVNEEGKAVLRGKVWKRGEQEPAEWTIQGEDLLPNVVGSPGFFGDAKTAEIFYDNVTVTRNPGSEELAPAAAATPARSN